VWGILCLLLIALWVRSYDVADFVWGPVHSTRAFTFDSIRGRLVLTTSIAPPGTSPMPLEYGSDRGGRDFLDFKGNVLGFYLWRDAFSVMIVIPYWFLALATAALTATPWLRWRFSLRTLLIGMTVVAVVLGLAIVASRGS
jgi:hypothetical protein